MEVERSFFLRMGRVQRAFFEKVREQLVMGDLHPKQGPIIGLLLCHDGLSQADLVRELNVSAATVAVSVSRLEKLDIICRVRDEHNRRAYVLTLTDKGRAEGMRMREYLRLAEEAAMQGFTPAEREQLNTYCQRMLYNLQGDNKTKRKE